MSKSGPNRARVAGSRTVCLVATLVGAISIAFDAAGAQDGPPRVAIETGELRGRLANDVEVFQGIPYAAPPVGPLRWRPPQTPTRHGSIDASRYRPNCPQLPIESPAASNIQELSEDCLYLNVWRPARGGGAQTKSEKLPVLVWIHGGGYVNGGSWDPLTDGATLARGGLVVVTFNYRLGRFGFFAHPALTASEPGPYGNYAYMDQLAALRWVQRNIAAFGGDSSAVTIMGESAGGHSVYDLLVSPAATGLFHRAIAMSGGGRWFLGGSPLRGGTYQNPSAEDIGVNFAWSAEIDGTDSRALRKLRALPPAVITGRNNMLELVVTAVLPRGPLTFARGPIVDGTIVLDTAGNLFASGRMARVPVMIGSTGFDLPGWYPSSKKELFAQFGPDAETARRLYDPADTVPFRALVLAFGADAIMQEPARFVARTMARAGMASWLYRFDYVADSARGTVPGAEHASEVPYLFNTLAERYGAKLTANDQATADAFAAYIVNFAKSGDPNGPGLPAWRRMSPSSTELMLFTNSGARMTQDPLKERLDVVERMATTQPKPIPVAQLALGSWTGFAAMGALWVPRYPGSTDSHLVPFPLLEMRYQDRIFAALGTAGLGGLVGVEVYRRATWAASGQLLLADRRRESDANALAGLRSQGYGLNVGGALRHRRGIFNQSLSLNQGVNSGAGLSANLTAGVGMPISILGAVGLNAVVTAADRQQMKYVFGIAPDEARRRQALIAVGDRRLRPADAVAFIPAGGLQSVGANATATMLVSRQWLAAAMGGMSYLTKPAAESPLVHRRAQWMLGFGVGRRIQ